MKKYSLGGVIAAAVLSLILLACSTTPGAHEELLAQITITHATQKVIESGDNASERAAKIVAHATEAKRLLSGEQVTLPHLEKAIQQRLVDEKLSPADLLLVNSLVRAIAIELSRKVGSEHLNADQKLAVERVLDWVIAASSLYAPHQTDL